MCFFWSRHPLHCWGTSRKAQKGSWGRMWQSSARCDIWWMAWFQWPRAPVRYSDEFGFIEVFNKFQMTWLKSWVCNSASTGSSLLCAAVGSTEHLDAIWILLTGYLTALKVYKFVFFKIWKRSLVGRSVAYIVTFCSLSAFQDRCAYCCRLVCLHFYSVITSFFLKSPKSWQSPKMHLSAIPFTTFFFLLHFLLLIKPRTSPLSEITDCLQHRNCSPLWLQEWRFSWKHQKLQKQRKKIVFSRVQPGIP